MNSLERVSFLSVTSVISILALAILAPACESVSVPPWPYTIEGDAASAPSGASDDGASDSGASDSGASDDASDQETSGAGGIQANYTASPLRCDGGLCNTDNYSLCNIADNPAASRAVRPLSALLVVAGMACARRRRRRKAKRSS